MAHNLTRFNPFGDLARLDPFRDIERFFDELDRPMQNDLARSMRMDVSETDQAYVIRAEMPGFDKQDINVSVDGKTVTIRAKRDEQQPSTPQSGTMLRTERFHGEQYRSFTLPQEVDDQQASATCNNGVLELTLPKRAGGHGRQLQIQ